MSAECLHYQLHTRYHANNKVIYVTYNPGLEGWLYFSTIQLLPIDASEEGVAGHGALSTLWGHTAQTAVRVFGQELWKTKDGWIHRHLKG